MNASVLAPAGPFAAWIAEASWLLFAGAALIFVFVMLLLALALRRAGHVRRGLWIVGGGVVFPVVVLSALLAYSLWLSVRLAQPPPADAIVVGITGHMWWWEVRYRDPQSGREIVMANELRLPLGRKVLLGLTSADVIHSLWVPSLAGKVDLVPGHVNHLVVQADAAGVYRGPCAEFCGAQHARMELRVAALPQAEFDVWLAAQALPAPEPGNAMQMRGREAFIEQRCVACHTVRGIGGPEAALPPDGPAPAAGVTLAPGLTLGPDLTHVGSRLTLGAGTLPNNRGALIAWIADVQHFKRGARMPSFDRLDAPTLQALAAYLESLK